jgi:predicted DNA-binding transcriptional regulator YafY
MATNKRSAHTVSQVLVDRVYAYLSKRKTAVSVAALAERFGRKPNSMYQVFHVLRAQGTKLVAERAGKYVAYRIE